MKSFAASRFESRFQAWLEEDIYVGSGTEHCARKYVIETFIDDLCTFIERGGYIFSGDEGFEFMVADWARFLYRVQHGLMKRFKMTGNPNERPEDYDMFCYVFDYTRCHSFLKQWESMDDFARNPNGDIAFNCIFDFAWYHIDINSSSTTKRVNNMLALSDNENDDTMMNKRRGKNTDAYLEDQENAISKYNRWD